MPIALTPVKSTRVEAIGYEAETQTLAIKFPPSRSAPEGSTYHYADVSPETAAAFVAAESPGKFFETDIRGKYAYVKQEPAPPVETATTAQVQV